MRTSPPALAPYLRSATQAELLAALLLHPSREMSVADLARKIGAPPSVALKEVDRLLAANVLRQTRVGRARLVQANPDYRLLEPLTQIITSTYGPAAILTEELREIPGIEAAYIFGSWAARYTNHPGAQPGDVDVLVIGDPARAEINDAAARAEARLEIEVQITKISSHAWEAGTEPFLRTVKDRPLLELDLSTAVPA